VIDVRNRAAPYQVAAYNTPGRARGVTSDGIFVYVADYEGGLRVYLLV
jgi:hypothetical protein